MKDRVARATFRAVVKRVNTFGPVSDRENGNDTKHRLPRCSFTGSILSRPVWQSGSSLSSKDQFEHEAFLLSRYNKADKRKPRMIYDENLHPPFLLVKIELETCRGKHPAAFPLPVGTHAATFPLFLLFCDFRLPFQREISGLSVGN